jgi:hypothetical protein
LSAVWTHFRRLVASLMLVAMTSFVLHGGAMAGVHQHGMGSTECAPPASAGHIHQAAAHDHSAAHSHQPEHDHGSAVISTPMQRRMWPILAIRLLTRNPRSAVPVSVPSP